MDALIQVGIITMTIQPDNLLQAKAGINYRTANGASALVLAAELGSGEVSELHAITSLIPSLQLVNLLLQHKADVDIADAQGATALHWAVQVYEFPLMYSCAF